MIGLLPWRGLAALAYMAGIFGLSSLPGARVASFGLGALLTDLAHIPLFAGLGSVTLVALTGPTLPRVALALGLALAFALTDELHQTLVPGRVFSAADLGFDALGVTLGVCAVLWWQASARRREVRQ